MDPSGERKHLTTVTVARNYFFKSLVRLSCSVNGVMVWILKEQKTWVHQTMKFEKRRVTDMKTFRRIIPPAPLSTEETIVLKNMTDRIRKETEEYITKSCNKKGIPKKNNLTKDQTKNLRSLEKRVKSGEVVIMQNDKSTKLTINKPDNYIEQMKPHLRDDPRVTTDEQNTMERTLTGHAIQWGRILKMGWRGDNNNNNDKHWTRIKSALTTKTAFTPPLYGRLSKDHKKLQEGREDQGHPVRPVCGATESMNGPLSDVLSEILTTLGDEMDETIDTLCLSTEEMCHALEAFNQKVSEDHQNNIKEPVIFSMDVAAMFPSLDIAEVA